MPPNNDDPNAFSPVLEGQIFQAIDAIEAEIKRLQSHLAAFAEADIFNRHNFAVTANQVYVAALLKYNAYVDSK